MIILSKLMYGHMQSIGSDFLKRCRGGPTFKNYGVPISLADDCRSLNALDRRDLICIDKSSQPFYFYTITEEGFRWIDKHNDVFYLHNPLKSYEKYIENAKIYK